MLAPTKDNVSRAEPGDLQWCNEHYRPNRLEFDSPGTEHEPGGPYGVTIIAGQSGPNCHRALPGRVTPKGVTFTSGPMCIYLQEIFPVLRMICL